MDLQKSDCDFGETPWSLVDALRGDDDEQKIRARERLANTYWPAIYSFLRRRGLNRHDAAEATQAFFGEVVLSRMLFEHADPGRARLRSLILTALQNYLVDQHRRNVSRGEKLRISLELIDQIDDNLARHANGDPVDAYEQQWVAAQLVEALRRCEARFDDGDSRNWKVFLARIIHPAINGCDPPSSQALAEEFGFDSPAAVNSAVYVARKRMVAMLKEVIAETTTGEGAAEEEYEQLRHEFG